MDYALALSHTELLRYRMMAARARTSEAGLWRRAGITPGAVVADVGCGPGAVTVELAAAVSPGGRVVAVDRDEAALAAARQVTADAEGIELRTGLAWDTGLPEGSFDVVVMRHVLAHNGPDEQRIVDHLARLLRPGGHLYLADIDGTAMRALDLDPQLADLPDRYAEFHRRRGNDLLTGLRLALLIRRAGLEVVTHEGAIDIIAAPPGMRPPPWAAREAMLAEGVVTADDLARWEQAFDRLDASPIRPTLFVTRYVGIGRRPTS